MTPESNQCRMTKDGKSLLSYLWQPEGPEQLELPGCLGCLGLSLLLMPEQFEIPELPPEQPGKTLTDNREGDT